jgi:5,10-methylenetetrahydromethanopterin reductase
MDAGSLDEVARGRVILSIGRVLNALRKHAIDGRGTIELVKESIAVIKGMSSGKLTQYEGNRVKIAPPGSRLDLDLSGELPIYIGATGPAMLRLAGEYADGVLFNYPSTPAFIRYAMPIIEEGLTSAGRTIENFDVAAYLLVSVHENEKTALDAAKRFVAHKLPTRHSDMLRYAGVSAVEIEAVRNTIKRFGLARAAAQIDDDIVRKVAITGTPTQVIGGIKEFLGTGLKLPIVWEIIGPDRRQALATLAKEVMPKLF